MPATNSTGKTSGALTDGASRTNGAQTTNSSSKTRGVLTYGASNIGIDMKLNPAISIGMVEKS